MAALRENPSAYSLMMQGENVNIFFLYGKLHNMFVCIFILQLRYEYGNKHRSVFKMDELGSEIARIALPAALALTADPIASLIDTAFIGQIGTLFFFLFWDILN